MSQYVPSLSFKKNIFTSIAFSRLIFMYTLKKVNIKNMEIWHNWKLNICVCVGLLHKYKKV